MPGEDFASLYAGWLKKLPDLKGKKIQVVPGRRRPGSPDYRAFVREVHSEEAQQRENLHSLPDLDRIGSPPGHWTRRRPSTLSAQDSFLANELLLPAINTATPSTRSNIRHLEDTLEKCLDSRTRRRIVEYLLASANDMAPTQAPRRTIRASIAPTVEAEDSKTSQSSVSKRESVRRKGSDTEEEEEEEEEEVGYPGVRTIRVDDIIAWQPGLVGKDVNGQATLRSEEQRKFHKDTLSEEATLQKTTALIRMMKLKGKVRARSKEIEQGDPAGRNLRELMLVRGPEEELVDWQSMNAQEGLVHSQQAIRRTMLLQACTQRAHRHLLVKDKQLTSEAEWRINLEHSSVTRQNRQRLRIQQTRWLPVIFVAQATRHVRAIIRAGRALRNRMHKEFMAAQVIQRYFRRVVARRYRLSVGWRALRHLRFKAYRWIKLARTRQMHKKIELVKTFLRDWRSQRSIQQMAVRFKTRVVRCQFFIRAFLRGQRRRRKETGKLWDEVCRDVLGDESSHGWMYRILHQSGTKASTCEAEVKRMRRKFIEDLRAHKNEIIAYRSKVEAYAMIRTIGMDEQAVRTKLGIAAKPSMPVYPYRCDRKVMRKHVEDAVHRAGIMSFVDKSLLEQLNLRVDEMLKEVHEKLARMLFLKQSAKEIFDMVDDDGSGRLEEEEIHRLLQMLGLRVSAQEARAFFKKLDTVNKGNLSYPEFMDRLMKWKESKKDVSNRLLMGDAGKRVAAGRNAPLKRDLTAVRGLASREPSS